jgi:transposase
MAPLVRTSLAPAGHRPVLRHQAKHRQKVSIAAALSRSPGRGRVRMSYEIFPEQYIDNFLYADFLRTSVLGQLRGPIVLIHDGGALHRGDWIEDLLEDVHRLEVHELPPYAPELNPVEQLWNWAKDKELVNFLPTDIDQLTIASQHTMRCASHDQSRLQTFFEAVPLKW